MAQHTRSDLHAAIEQRFPDNTNEEITPERLRNGLHELVDSAFLPASDKLPAAHVTAQLLGFDPATGEFLVLLSPSAPATKTSYVLAEYGAGTTPGTPTTPTTPTTPGTGTGYVSAGYVASGYVS